MSKFQGRQKHHVKSMNLALQGGGAHGAFTWGVLDRLFEDGRIWIEAISGTSAGAMNAVVAAQGMYDGGGDGARAELERFWREVSISGRASPIQRSFFDQLLGNWSLDNSPGYLMMDLFSRLASPYDLNPLGINPLKVLVERFIDFEKVRDCSDLPIFLSATNVETGRVRIFDREEVTLDVVMASACLPFLFHAVEIDGVPYWDGGYMGNPVLFPFIDNSPAEDILIVQINPMQRKGTPKTAREILNRVNEITFNSSLVRELRNMEFICRLLNEEKVSANEFRDMKVHMIEGTEALLDLGASSKMNAEWEFLVHLRDIGRAVTDTWLAAHFDDVGERTTVDLTGMFEAIGVKHYG
ncbi:MAG: patatin-like phospholipase family protein [Pseudomonadota bacterium]